MNPRYPVFVPTKGRWESRYTIRALEKIGVPFRAVVEAQEFDSYAAVVDPAKLLVLPHRDKGLVVTRNWIWDYAAQLGVKRFWTFDDNIQGFYRLNHNLKVPVGDGTILAVMEDFTERYTNVSVSGMNYFMFAKRKCELPPFYLNTRVYSNMLIETEARDPRGDLYRNEGFYNDDTDLCLRMLKDGRCTVLFNAFLIGKSVTMSVKGGMTSHYQKLGGAIDPKWVALAQEVRARGLYQKPADAVPDPERLTDGRWRMAAELAAKHPDVTRITRKWGRWQHHVDYSRFQRNRLEPVPGLRIDPATNDYGMKLIESEEFTAKSQKAGG